MMSHLPLKNRLFSMRLVANFLDGLNFTPANIITYFSSTDASNAVKSMEHHELN